MAIALSYRWGTGRSPYTVDGHSLLPGRSLALVVLIITQMGDRHEVAAPVDGRSIIVQMGDGAKPLHLAVRGLRFFVGVLFIKLLNDLSSQLFKLISFSAHIVCWRVPSPYKISQYAYLVI